MVNPNGVDVERFRPDSGGAKIREAAGVSGRIVIGFVGTFGPWHGAPVLAEAASQISESARCHFLFIGDGEQRSKVEEIIDSASNVSATFAGRIPHAEVPAYLDACDIFAAPNVPAGDGSEFFGSPTKLFEYMSMARPVVASRVRDHRRQHVGQLHVLRETRGAVGLRFRVGARVDVVLANETVADVIEDGFTGVLVEPGDACSLARAIEELASDEELRAKLGRAARQTVIERYTWRHNAERVFDTMRPHCE